MWEMVKIKLYWYINTSIALHTGDLRSRNVTAPPDHSILSDRSQSHAFHYFLRRRVRNCRILAAASSPSRDINLPLFITYLLTSHFQERQNGKRAFTRYGERAYLPSLPNCVRGLMPTA